MKNNKRGVSWLTGLVGFGLLAGLAVGCTEKAMPPGFSSLAVHLNAGETTAPDLDLSSVQTLSLTLHPRDTVRTASATGGTLTIQGQTLNASVLASSAGDSHAGDLTAIFQKCSQVRAGKNVEVRYVFTDVSGQVLEGGSAVLGNIIGTCPASP